MNAKAWLLLSGLVAAPAAWAQHDHHDAPPPAPAQATQAIVDHAAVDHATMDHATMDHAAQVDSSALPRTPVPALTDADRAAARPPPHDHPVHDDGIFSYVLIDRLEGWSADPGIGVAWGVQGWLGTDLHRLWVRSEGERVDGRLHGADVELLYGRSVSPWWDVVAGVRHDAIPGAPRDFVAVGVQGLAPGKFEVAATGYLGSGGQVAARFEVEYETLLTNRLVLQPRFEADAYGKNDTQRGTGAGLATTAFGLRLRYEVTRRFAPYVGVEREQAHGRTATWRRAAGEGAAETRWVAGLRAWF